MREMLLVNKQIAPLSLFPILKTLAYFGGVMSNPKLIRIRIPISIRLPERLLNAVDKYVKDHAPAIKDRTHAVEVALDKLLKEK